MLDAREQVNSLAERDELVSIHAVTEGLKVYVKETKTLYVWNGESWDDLAKGAGYTHPTTPGYKHIPAGGTKGQILKNKADGEAEWGKLSASDVGAIPATEKEAQMELQAWMRLARFQRRSCRLTWTMYWNLITRRHFQKTANPAKSMLPRIPTKLTAGLAVHMQRFLHPLRLAKLHPRLLPETKVRRHMNTARQPMHRQMLKQTCSLTGTSLIQGLMLLLKISRFPFLQMEVMPIR